ncbi:cobalt-zinc-cadmium resistance protein [Ralstonia pickettii]|uniref:Cobalt-zinc-cadmium resistance protein n=1 Tax=Ralstonia pickettii TaxID=329 RepID=A0A7X2HKB1_RALPI|nr:TolC family protein [Ralstonia pickettii]MRS98082.1 cobalt-zinc-cadmium resistance protein [Ralstonia pickettii]
MRRLILPLGLAVFSISPSFAADSNAVFPNASGSVLEAPGPLTLERAMELATAGNFTLSAAQKEVDANEGAVMQARVIPNPEVAATVEDTRKESRTATGQLNIPLELGGKRSARIAAAEKGRELAQAQLATTRAEIRSSVIGAFFAVLVAQERVKLAKGSADIAAKGAVAASRRVAAGKISPVDETKAKVEQANAELELDNANAELLSARTSLAALWGNAAPQFSEAQGNLDILPARPKLSELLMELEHSPLVLADQIELDRRQALVGVERSRQYPDVTVSMGAKRDSSANRNMAVLGVSIPLPLFDRNQGNLYEAMRRADKAQDELLANRIRLTTEMQQASTELTVSRQSAQALKTTILPASEQAYSAATRGFEAGKFNFLDVLDAQRTLFQARIRYLDVLAKVYQSTTTIDRLLGR